MAESALLITDAELLQLGLPGTSLSGVAVAVRDEARAAASDTALSYIKKRFGLPLLAWGSDIKRAVAHIAVYDLMAYRGYAPESGVDALIAKRHDDALAWLRDVARGIVEPIDIEDSTAAVDEQAPLVSSESVAGWNLPTSDTLIDDCGCN